MWPIVESTDGPAADIGFAGKRDDGTMADRAVEGKTGLATVGAEPHRLGRGVP